VFFQKKGHRTLMLCILGRLADCAMALQRRKRMNWKLVGVCLLGLGSLAMAANPEKSESSAAEQPAEKSEATAAKRPVTASERRLHGNRVRCVNEQVTGSRFAKRICHTEDEWARLKESGVESVKHVQGSPIPVKSE
ncbi:MAG: hypothetical protein ACK4F7_04255, partial [Inhella sp.]